MTRDSRLPQSPIHKALQWVGIATTLGVLVSIGSWVGSIQEQVDHIQDDCNDNKIKITTNSTKLISAESTERDRLNSLSTSVRDAFNSDKDELWTLKQGMALINERVATFHSSRRNTKAGLSYSAEASPRERRKAVSAAADKAVSHVMQPTPEPMKMPSF